MYRVAAVLLTYATRRSIQFYVIGGGLLYALFLLALVAQSREASLHRAQAAMFMVGFPAGVIGFVLLSQAKWQFVDPRARILPNFATPHIATLATAAVAGLFGLPCLAGGLARLNILGFAACSIAIGASFIWSMHSNRMLPMLIGLATFYSLFSRAGASFWLLPELAPDVRVYHLAILIGGWAAFTAWLIRLVRMDEEDGDYQIPVQAQSGSATRLERSQASRFVGRQMARSPMWSRPSDVWHDRLMSWRPGQNARKRLLRYGFGPVPVELGAIWIGVVMLAVGWFSSRGFGSQERSGAMSMGTLAPFYFMPSMLAGQYLAMRRARLAQELLLPYSRTEFVDGLIKALARTTVVSFGVLTLVAVTLLAVSETPLPSPSSLVAYAVAAVAGQPYFFGMGVRTAIYSSAMARMAVMLLAIIPGMIAGILSFILINHGYITWTFLLSLVLVLVGVLVTRYARRKWLEAELG
jgi:hypothetical protein